MKKDLFLSADRDAWLQGALERREQLRDQRDALLGACDPARRDGRLVDGASLLARSVRRQSARLLALEDQIEARLRDITMESFGR